MTRSGVTRSGAKLGWLDYLLTAIGSILAVYSAGMSIDAPEIGLFCGALIVVGTICSYTIKVAAGSGKLVRLDGPVYAIASIGAIAFAPALMTVLPVGGFPAQLTAAGGLCWMLVFGSFLSWGDSTLLFQAVPGIALFGLVGCYDTYRNVVFAFFGFLICLCTGFARAHGREMLRRAAESGYFDRAGIRFDAQAPEQSAELYDAIRRGPWRWVAGPEWALLSALGIVLISLLGAPAIQASVQGVAGFASIRLPNTKRNTTLSQLLSQDRAGSTMVGQGPVTGMTGEPVYEVKMDHARYLRSHWYEFYNGKGWFGEEVQPLKPSNDLEDFTLLQVSDPVFIDFEESPRVVTRTFALPGEWSSDSITDAHLQISPEGTYVAPEPIDIGRFITGRSLEARDPQSSDTAIHPTPPILTPYLDVRSADARILTLAREVVKDSKNDKQRAQAIMQAIVAHAKYNANISPTPAAIDPVEYFLFESHEGYCDLFASSMTIMARGVGIPARYVTGYLPDERAAIDGDYVVRDSDFHAWAELFFKNVGWVVYDPTSIADVVPGGAVKIQNPDDPDMSLIGKLMDGAIVGLLGFAGVMLWRTRRKGPQTEDRRRKDIDQVYISFARTLRSFTGRRRLLSETPSEYLEQTRPALNGSYALAESMTRKFEHAFYSTEQVGEAELADLNKDLRELKKMLQAERKATKATQGPPP